MKWTRFLWLGIPATADFITSMLQYTALNFIDPSIYQMLRGGLIIVMAITSVCCLNMRLVKRHYVGCAFVVIGIVLVGLSNFIFPKEGGKAEHSTFE